MIAWKVLVWVNTSATAVTQCVQPWVQTSAPVLPQNFRLGEYHMILYIKYAAAEWSQLEPAGVQIDGKAELNMVPPM